MSIASLATLFFAFAVGASLLAALLSVQLRRAKSRIQSMEQQQERSHDEIWELKSAAAERDRAEAASEAKSRFLATVSHEFRTPLNGILGLAELLAETPMNAEQDSYLAAIRASGDALSSLINEILDFSRLEAGKLELRRSEFDLPALVEGAVELLSPRAQGKGIEICSLVDKDLPRLVIGDSGRLRQVLINLVGNAVKFTDTGGVALDVAMGAERRLRFSIFDTGPGISESQEQLIFEDFEQGDGSSTRRQEGAGLGLAISRRIVEHMGGRLWLEKTGRQGSQFCFEIPLERPSAPDVRDVGRQLADKRIMVVSDTPFGCARLAQRLSDAGARTVVARDRAQAASTLGSAGFSQPDFAIVDCSLGESAIGELSDLFKRFPDCKCVLLFSPFERRAFGDDMLKQFHGWLVKPVRLESVVTKIVYFTSRKDEKAKSETSERLAPILAGKRFLLAEDNDVNALLVERQLCKLGASSCRARNGIEAVKLVEDSFAGSIPRFTAILMDLRMPALDGLSAARRIREIEHAQGRQPATIIALTANAFDEDRDAALSAGMQTFLTKPLNLSALVQTLDELAADANVGA
jgi:signal transduction histidine kinase/DNA-binding response OmpR family regulator